MKVKVPKPAKVYVRPLLQEGWLARDLGTREARASTERIARHLSAPLGTAPQLLHRADDSRTKARCPQSAAESHSVIHSYDHTARFVKKK